MSLGIPDGRQQAGLRIRFAECAAADWKKLLAFAGRKGVVSAEETRLLDSGLEALAPEHVGSEFFHSYFAALEVLTARDWDAARAAVLRLGNVLVGDTVDDPMPMPVARVGAGVDIPAALQRSNPCLRAAADIVRPEEITAQADEVRQAIAGSWIAKPEGRPGMRGSTSPVLTQITNYAEETERLGRLAGEEPNPDPSLRVIDAQLPLGSAVLERFEAAMELVELVDLEQAREITVFTEYVVPLEGGSQFVGGSALALYGATFLRLDPSWTALCFADHLVHEASHQLIHAAQEMDPMLINRDYVGAPSPIRSDPRPLYGSFHATFVFLRLAQFMRAVLSVQPDSSVAEEAEIRFHRHLLGLLQGLDSLIAYGDFTRKGREELDGWIESAASLRTFRGDPAPEACVRLNWDYEAPRDLRVPAVAS
jgi:hypothetical protein